MRTTNSYYNNGTLTPTRDPYHHPRGSAKSAPAFLLQPVHDDTGRPTPEDTADNAAAAAPQNNPFVLSMNRSDDHYDRSQRLPFRNHRHKEDTCANADATTATAATVNASASAAHWHPFCQQSFFPVFRSSPVMPRYRSRDDDRFYTLQRSPAFDCDDDC